MQIPNNPQVQSLINIISMATTIIGPGSLALYGVHAACFADVSFLGIHWCEAQVVAASDSEGHFAQLLGPMGATPVWNFALSWVGSHAETLLDGHLWLLASYRMLIAALSIIIVAPMAWAAYRCGQAIALDGFDNGILGKSHRAVWAWYGLTWAVALPGILASLPINIYSPITIPLLLCITVPWCAYSLGKNTPFEV